MPEGRETAADRCPSRTWLNCQDYACSYPAKAKHDECMALVRGDNGQDVAVKWAKR